MQKRSNPSNVHETKLAGKILLFWDVPALSCAWIGAGAHTSASCVELLRQSKEIFHFILMIFQCEEEEKTLHKRQRACESNSLAFAFSSYCPAVLQTLFTSHNTVRKPYWISAQTQTCFPPPPKKCFICPHVSSLSILLNVGDHDLWYGGPVTAEATGV